MFSAGHVDSVEAGDSTLTVRTSDVERLGADIARLATETESRLTAFLPQDESLESVFRYLVERR
jgi:ABC-2 type transport system ATP-binding protein